MKKILCVLGALALLGAGCDDSGDDGSPGGAGGEGGLAAGGAGGGEGGAGGVGGSAGEGVFDPTGTYLAAAALRIEPSKPIEFRMELTATPEGEPLAISGSLQPLVTRDSTRTDCPDPSAPVGDAITFADVPVTASGFEIDLPSVAIDGCANPISGGDIEASLTISTDSFEELCGTVDGTVTSPISASLDGSTWAAQPFDFAAGEPLPPVQAACP